MKHEILKKTLLYRLLAFGLGTFITSLFLWKDPLLSLNITLVSESASIGLYYIYEYLWRRHIKHSNIKKGMSVLLIKGSDKHNWYEVIEDLGEGKLTIKVV